MPMDLVVVDMAASMAIESRPISSLSHMLSKPAASAWRARSRTSRADNSLPVPSSLKSMPMRRFVFICGPVALPLIHVVCLFNKPLSEIELRCPVAASSQEQVDISYYRARAMTVLYRDQGRHLLLSARCLSCKSA